MPNTSPNYLANGNIFPSTIVMIDTSVAGGLNVKQATVNSRGVGVAQEGSRTAPTPDVATPLAAIAGDPIKVYGDGDECLVLLAGSVSPGDFVVAAESQTFNVYFDSVAYSFTGTGAAIKAGSEATAGGVQNIVGRMLEGGSQGEFRRMQVLIFQTTVSSS